MSMIFRAIVFFCLIFFSQQSLHGLKILSDEIINGVNTTEEFQKFMKNFKRNYKNDTEHQVRFQTFIQNLKEHQSFNKNQQGTAKFGITKFADWTKEEKDSILIKTVPNIPKKNSTRNLPRSKRQTSTIPANFDFRNYSLVTPVRNQGSCGACWSFSAVATIESQVLWNSSVVPASSLDLSEQELIDCNTDEDGCNGGLPTDAYDFVKANGIVSDLAYPYQGADNTCSTTKTNAAKTFISDWDYFPGDVPTATNYVYWYGPASLLMWAPNDLYSYTSGVYWPSAADCSNATGGHAVTVIGYGVNKNLPYWLIKNSWGTSWGMNGYFMLYRGNFSTINSWPCNFYGTPMSNPWL